ncbi:MAG: lamin tail domain-containing protein, partial [Planctomycetes bacterium]|nr:lamin tail domain-containing protein [Planctomycetota bacterium]
MRPSKGVLCLGLMGLLVSFWGQAGAVVINEIMYNPPRTRANTEFVEIYNESTIPYDISAYYFSSGITFTFPEGTRIEPDAYLLVVEDAEAFLTAYPSVDPATVFQFEAGKLDNTGERLALANPGGGELSVVSFKDGGRWPSQADGAGHSLSLIDPFLQTDEVESWAASPVPFGTPGGPNGLAGGRIETTLIPEGAQWRMFKGTQEPSTPIDAWRDLGFADAGWALVTAGIGYDDGDDTTILDDMRSGYMSIYIRRVFDLASLPEGASLVLQVLYDDGFVAYLNGTEVARSTTMEGRGVPPAFGQTSGSHEANGTFEAFDITAHAGLLRAGGNVLAIQGHNASLTSTDFSLHPKLVISEVVSPATSSPIVFNEFYHDEETGWIELYNRSGSAIDAGGMYLSNDPDSLDLYRIPDGTTIPSHGFLLIGKDELPFDLIPTENPNPDPGRVGELRLKLYLSATALDRVIAAHRFDWLEGLGSTGRFPDGAALWYTLPDMTPGEENALVLDDRIVIDEIMYHPITEDPADEYLELYNRGGETVDLSGWSFTKGIDYVLPDGTSLAPGAYLVVAKDPEHIRQKYGITNVTGPFVGFLANDGERIRLCDLNGNPADEVRYFDGYPWPKYADGGGSSLELIDPRQDNALISAWGASDEEPKAEWTYYEYTKSHRSRISRTPDSEIQFCLMTRGECLLDDIKLTRSGTDYVRNGSFESGTSNWVIQGTHIDSQVVSGGKVGASCLRVISSGRGDQLENRIEQQLNGTLTVNQTYTISFWAKWQRGCQWFLTRTHGHGVAQAHRLAIPERLGTPGGPNSIARPNQGPVMDGLTQSPIRPSATQTVGVAVRVQDADGIQTVVIRHVPDGTGSFASAPMYDDGAHGDGAAGDGLYGGSLPARTNLTIVRFYVEATDALGATEVFPAGSPDLACVYQVDGTQDAGPLWHYRIIHTTAVENELNSRTRMSNHLLPATFLFGDRDIFHNAMIRYRGSPWTRPGNPKGYRVRFPSGRPLRGIFSEINLDGQGQDGTHQHDRIAFWLERKINRLAYSDVEYARVHVDGGGSVLYDEPRKIDMDYARLFWPTEDDGYLFKVDDYFEFYNDSNGDRSYSDAYLNYVGQDREEYRWMFKLRSREYEEDAAYEKLIDFAAFMDPNRTGSAAFDSDVWSWIDVDEWLGHLAIRFLIDDWDGYGYN